MSTRIALIVGDANIGLAEQALKVLAPHEGLDIVVLGKPEDVEALAEKEGIQVVADEEVSRLLDKLILQKRKRETQIILDVGYGLHQEFTESLKSLVITDPVEKAPHRKHLQKPLWQQTLNSKQQRMEAMKKRNFSNPRARRR